jgi:hypothetical protein
MEKEFIVERGDYRLNEKSVGLRVIRFDGSEAGFIYFGLSIVKIKERDNGDIRITVPKEILMKKLLPGYTIRERR